MTGKDLLSIFEIEDLAGEPSVEGILRIIAGAGEVIGMLEGGGDLNGCPWIQEGGSAPEDRDPY